MPISISKWSKYFARHRFFRHSIIVQSNDRLVQLTVHELPIVCPCFAWQTVLSVCVVSMGVGFLRPPRMTYRSLVQTCVHTPVHTCTYTYVGHVTMLRVSVKKALLRRRIPLRQLAWKTPNRELESTFFPLGCMAHSKGVFFHRHKYSTHSSAHSPFRSGCRAGLSLSISLSLYIYIYISRERYTYLYTCICIYIYTHVYIYIYIQYTRIYVYMYTCIYVYTSLSLYVYVYIYIYIHTYTYIHVFGLGAPPQFDSALLSCL